MVSPMKKKAAYFTRKHLISATQTAYNYKGTCNPWLLCNLMLHFILCNFIKKKGCVNAFPEERRNKVNSENQGKLRKDLQYMNNTERYTVIPIT